MEQRRLRPEKYTVGWVSALPIELAAAKVMLDEEHRTETDGSALYTLGRIGEHNVVLGCLPAGQMGTNSAAVVATSMKARYKAIRIGLMVGIGGGVPSNESDIRLGDVVVSQPHLGHGGVIQYDFGKTTTKGFARTGILSPPPMILLNALARVQADHHVNTSRLSSYLASFDSLPDFGREIAGPDVLFKSSYQHVAGPTCDGCNRNEIVNRRPRSDQHFMIHYGTIASGNQVIKDAITRDELNSKLGGILCFEMEAAGLMNTFPCLVIRGICDYADSHKNKTWQPYAAATAAAFAKEIINIIPGDDVMETPTTAEGTHVKSTEIFRMTQGEKDCLQSLCFPEMNLRQNDISDPTPDTCEWLSHHSMYRKWIDGQHPLLWIKGNPGAGKSTLLRHALTLDEQDPDENKPIIASFFFHGRGAEIQKSVLGLFRSLLHQILRHFPCLLRDLSLLFERRCEAEGKIGEKWNWQERDLQDFFKRNVPNAAKIRPVRVFIDALDESGEIVARQLVKFFEAIASTLTSNQPSLSICFTCRHYPLVSLEDGFEICVDAENREDIVTYIQRNIQSSIREESVATRIQEEVLQKSLGNFQWVVLVLPEIIHSYRKGKWKVIQKYIQDIPSELNQLYGKLVEEIDEETLSESLQLFQWICFAIRPLSLEELRFAMIVDVDTPHQSIRECQESEKYAETDEEMKNRVLDLSRGLAEIKIHEGKQVAQFIHQSVKDYLIQSGLHVMSKSTTDSVIGRAHYRLSRSCIRYISMNEIGDLPREDKWESKYNYYAEQELTRIFPFIEYALRYWISHVEIAEKENLSQEDLLSFLRYPSDDILHIFTYLHQKMWGHVLRYDQEDTYYPIQGTSLLHIASAHNLISVINSIFRSNNVELNLRNAEDDTPLHVAIRNGHEAVVKLLIGRGKVDVNSKNLRRETPLSIATEYGQETMVQLLLERNDVDVNSKNRWDETPLFIAAAADGYETVIRLLLERNDVDVNSRNKENQTPLFAAAINGDETVLQLLLERNDVDVNFKDQWNRTPLFAAAKNGHEAVIRLLLERNDVDVNSKDQQNESPLFAAASNGHEAVIRLLLKRNDIDVNSKNQWNRTPLFVAAEYGHETAVRLLLERNDVDVNSKDERNESPLFAAASNGHEAVIRLLLKRNDVYVNSRDQFDQTPLFVAAINGHEAVIRLLLERNDVHVNFRTQWKETPLFCAAENGHEAGIRLLLEQNDVDVNSRDRWNQTSLFVAAANGHRTVVKLLLARDDVDVNSKNQWNRTPLHIAAIFGHATVVKFLLARDDIEWDSKDIYDQTPLDVAKQFRREAVVKLLESFISSRQRS